MILRICIAGLFIISSTYIQAQKFETKLVNCRQGCVLEDPYFVEGVTFTWNGKCIKGKADGEGTAIKYENGQLHSTYKGHYEAGIRKGPGKMIRHLSDEYWEGVFCDGQLSGHGKHLAYKMNLYYEGDFYNYFKQGRGNEYYSDGSYFSGLFNFFAPYYGVLTDEKGNKSSKYGNFIAAIFEELDLIWALKRPQIQKKFYNREWKEVPENQARYIREYKYTLPQLPVDTIITSYITGEKESMYVRLRDSSDLNFSNLRRYHAKWYYNNDKIRASCYFDHKGMLSGPFIMYNENEAPLSETYFDKDFNIVYTADFYPDGTPKRLYYGGNGKDYPETLIEIDSKGNGFLIHEHDFLKNKSFWTITEMGGRSYISIDNMLTLDVPDNFAKFRGIQMPANLTSDFTIECTVGRIEGDSPKGYGLVFGHASWENHFQFLISEIGSFYVFSRKNGRDFNIINWKYGKSIRKQNQKNELRIVKKNDTFNYYINGLLAGSSNAQVLSGQAIGLIAAGKGIYTMQNLKIKEHLDPATLNSKLVELDAVKAAFNDY